MLHGAGIFTNICPKTHPNLGKYTSAMVRIWDWAAMGNLDSIADVAVEIAKKNTNGESRLGGFLTYQLRLSKIHPVA